MPQSTNTPGSNRASPRWRRNGPSSKDVARLRRRFSGLNENLNYMRNHAIYKEYHQYKDACIVADHATAKYDHEVNRLKAGKTTELHRWARGGVGGKTHYEDNHEHLASLAEEASRTAGVYAELRKSFNAKYKPVLVAKGEDKGHELAAVLTRKDEAKYRAYAEKYRQQQVSDFRSLGE